MRHRSRRIANPDGRRWSPRSSMATVVGLSLRARSLRAGPARYAGVVRRDVRRLQVTARPAVAAAVSHVLTGLCRDPASSPRCREWSCSASGRTARSVAAAIPPGRLRAHEGRPDPSGLRRASQAASAPGGPGGPAGGPLTRCSGSHRSRDFGRTDSPGPTGSARPPTRTSSGCGCASERNIPKSSSPG